MRIDEAQFAAAAEVSRKAVEQQIAELAAALESGNPAVTLWAITSGIATAAAHTLCLIGQMATLDEAAIGRMREGLKAQIDDAYTQACAMHRQKPN